MPKKAGDNKAGKNKGTYQRWVSRGGLKRKLARTFKSCGQTFAYNWAEKRMMTGEFNKLVARYHNEPA